MSKVKDFKAVCKIMNGKQYPIYLKDLKVKDKEATEIKALGILIKTTNLKRNMYGDSFDYTGRFLTQVDFDIKNTSQTLIDNDSRYSLEIEYDFADSGNNKIINKMKHRSFLLKRVKNASN